MFAIIGKNLNLTKKILVRIIKQNEDALCEIASDKGSPANTSPVRSHSLGASGARFFDDCCEPVAANRR